MGTFFLAWSLVTTAFFLRLPPQTGSRLRSYAGKLLILTALVYLAANSLKKAKPEKTLLHENIREKAAYAISRTPADARIYIIWQESDGFEPRVMAYELSPRITSTKGGSWSLGKPYGPEDVWTVAIYPEDWQSVLKGYDYVLIGHADKPFWDNFGFMFAPLPLPPANHLFKVVLEKQNIKLLAI